MCLSLIYFLSKGMRKFSFSRMWIELTEACISAPSLAVLVNGESMQWFKSTKGLSQGDQMSPYFLILGMGMGDFRGPDRVKTALLGTN